MKFSIKWILVFNFICLICGMQIIFHAASHVLTEKVLVDHVRNIMTNISKSAMEKSLGYFEIARSSAALTQRLLSSDILRQTDWVHMERYFYDQLRIHPQFAGIYFAKPNGDFFYVSHNSEQHPRGFRTKHITHDNHERNVLLVFRDPDFQELQRRMDHEDAYDPRDRPWYRQAVDTRDLIWTDPYIFYTSQKPGITSAIPVYGAGGDLDGVVGIDIEIDDLSAFLTGLEIGKHGRVFILNQHGEIVAYHDIQKMKYVDPIQKDRLRLAKINEIDDPIALAAFQASNLAADPASWRGSKTSELVRITVGKEAYIGAFNPFPQEKWPWIIGITVPENDYLGDIRGNIRRLYMVAFAVSVLALLIGLYIARLVVRPITNLKKEVLAVKHQDFLRDFDTQSAISEIDSLSRSFKDMRKALQASKEENIRLQKELKQSHLSTIYRLAAASEFKDKDTAEHLQRISAYAVVIAEQLGFSPEEIELIKYASPMHDVGKIGIPDMVIQKNGTLTHEERQVIEQHTNIGGQILAPADNKLMDTAFQIAVHHHEKWDGSGYPNGASGEDIPLMARIVSLVDVFDALLSKRSYKEGISFETAVAMIEEARGTHFDPKCVDAFLWRLDDIRAIYREY